MLSGGLNNFKYFSRSGMPLTLQAFSEEDRNMWFEALDGKETVRALRFLQINKHGETTNTTWTVFTINYIVCVI